MSTIASSPIPFCQPSDLIAMCDERQIGDWLNVDNTRATHAQILQDPPLPLMASALRWATSQIEAALYMQQNYTLADLQQIYGITPLNPNGGTNSPGLTASRQMLVQLAGGLTLEYLFKFRHPGGSIDDVPYAREAHEMLDAIQKGKTIFGLLEHQQAGLAVPTPFINRCDPSLLTNQTGGRFFPGIGRQGSYGYWN